MGHRIRQTLILLLLATIAVGCGGRGPAPPPTPSPPEPSSASKPAVLRGAFVTYSRAARVLTIGNGTFLRKLWLHEEGKGLVTASLLLRTNGAELLSGFAEEFRIRAAGRDWIGYGGDLAYIEHDVEQGEAGARRLRVVLETPNSEKPTKDRPAFRVEVNYEISADLPLMRKWIELTNRGTVPLHVGAVTTERLALGPVPGAVRWVRDGTLETVSLPLRSDGGSGLLWLRVDVGEGRTVLLGVTNETPGPLKRFETDASGRLAVGTAETDADLWLQPNESAVFPSVFLWMGAGGDARTATDRWIAAFRRLYAIPKPRGDVGRVYVTQSALIKPEELRLLPPNSLVCVPYAWPSAWDGSATSAEDLRRAAETIRIAGHRFGLWVPVAWMPEGGSLAETQEWWATQAGGKPISTSWRGKPGLLASFATDYAMLARQSLLSIAMDLDVEGILLDGSLTGDVEPGRHGYGVAPRHGISRWMLTTRFLSFVGALRRERPMMTIGVAARTYGVTDGFDVALFPMAFLWEFGSVSADDVSGEYWRRVERIPGSQEGEAP